MQVPVEVLHCDGRALVVRLVEGGGCARCASGEGCGQRPWFHYLFAEDLALPRPAQGVFTPGQRLTLSLGPGALNWAALLCYGLPLLGFFLGLLLTMARPEGLQLLAGAVGLLAGVGLGRRWGQKWLGAALRLA